MVLSEISFRCGWSLPSSRAWLIHANNKHHVIYATKGSRLLYVKSVEVTIQILEPNNTHLRLCRCCQDCTCAAATFAIVAVLLCHGPSLWIYACGFCQLLSWAKWLMMRACGELKPRYLPNCISEQCHARLYRQRYPCWRRRSWGEVSVCTYFLTQTAINTTASSLETGGVHRPRMREREGQLRYNCIQQW